MVTKRILALGILIAWVPIGVWAFGKIATLQPPTVTGPGGVENMFKFVITFTVLGLLIAVPPSVIIRYG